MLRIFVIAAALCGPALSAAAASWQVDPDFRGKDAREEISGAACGPSECYAVNDETHWIQSFKIENQTITPGATLHLIRDDDEIDAEAIAYANGAFYVTGSHGLSRKKGKLRPAHFLVFRIEDGKIEHSARLGDLIEMIPQLQPYAKRRLNKNGANIEGLAALGDRLFFGFRGPSVQGTGFILEVSAHALFGTSNEPPRLHILPLGDRIGIRDMAAVHGRILLLTGPVNTLPRRYSVLEWVPGESAATPLLTLPPAPDGKPEGLLVLDESASDYSVLVFHDGARNGGPVERLVPKTPRER